MKQSKSSLSQMFFKTGSLKDWQYPQKTPVLESLFEKVAGLKACNFIKKRPQHRCFPVNIAKFLRATFFNRTLQKTTSDTPTTVQ